jgi:hypothetical protein
MHPNTQIALNGLVTGLPNKRLKLTGPAFKGIVRLCANTLAVQGGAPCTRQCSPRSLSAIR